jgi:methylphosphotriester-DNA--protein-cysteine methyltransferase
MVWWAGLGLVLGPRWQLERTGLTPLTAAAGQRAGQLRALLCDPRRSLRHAHFEAYEP